MHEPGRHNLHSQTMQRSKHGLADLPVVFGARDDRQIQKPAPCPFVRFRRDNKRNLVRCCTHPPFHFRPLRPTSRKHHWRSWAPLKPGTAFCIMFLRLSPKEKVGQQRARIEVCSVCMLQLIYVGLSGVYQLHLLHESEMRTISGPLRAYNVPNAGATLHIPIMLMAGPCRKA